jgi:signal transduction histidine kinase
MRTRNWSIRSKIIALITVPLVAFLALWIFATTLTAGPAFNLLHARTLVDQVGTPGIELVGQLQRERLFSVEYLSGTGPVPQALEDQRTATDRVAAEFRRTAGGDAVQNAANDALRNRIAGIFTELDSLTGNRGHIDRREIDAIGAQNFYNKAIDSAFKMFAACATFNDEAIDRELRALTTVGNGEEYLGRVDSLVAGATAAGSLNADMRNELLQDVGTARYLLDQGIDDMTSTERGEWVQLSASTGYIRLNQLLDQLVQDSKVDAPPPVASSVYRPTYVAVGQQVREFEDRATDSLAARATPLAVKVLVRLALAAVLGLLALIISLIVSVKIGRSIVGRLGRLRAEAQEMADERLPAVVRRLQRGEAVEVEVETPPLAYGLDEIGQLGNAFNDVQRTAVQSAVDEANVRRGINEVFLNIARRSQTLLHRQLALLDKMERREDEPQELEDLYRVDHLATRMRRHAEDLVILAGAAPGRGWRNPVPVIDVVRGAISEVEDYKRIDIRSVEQSAVLGRAVGDVIHLLAELLENAASFSPPHTRVQVGGQVLPNGYAIEIEDRGLGMTPEAIEEANRRLLEPPDFDPSDSARLGLFVVAQLAGRHGIRVSLRPSAYAGITAIVLIPGDLVVVGPGPAALPASSSSWERPLVGSGTEDRPSLAARQGPGQVSVAGRPVTISGTENALPAPPDTGWEPQPVSGQPAAGLSGPAPSTVAAELTADGLVQRRRNRRRPTDPKPTAPAGSAGSSPASLADLGRLAGGLTSSPAPGGSAASGPTSLAGSGGSGDSAGSGPTSPGGSGGSASSGSTRPGGSGGSAGSGPTSLAGSGGGSSDSAAPRIPAPRSPESPVTPTSSSPLFPQAGVPGPGASGPPAPTSAAPMFAAPTSGPPSPDKHRPTGTGTPGDDPATGSGEPGDRKPGEGSAAVSGLPSGLGWPTGLGSPAGLDLPALDAPTISLPAVGRPPGDRRTRPGTPGDTGPGSSGGTDSPASGGTGSNGSGSGLGSATGDGLGGGNGLGSNGRGFGASRGGDGAAGGPGAPVSPAEPGTSTEDGLPKRVRQANLAPQLRHRPPTALPDEETVPLRPPEQIRAIMSALQQGTQRGRRDAARIEADPTSRETAEPSNLEKTVNEAPSAGASFADAATVSFPAIVDLATTADAAKDGTGADAAAGTGQGDKQSDVTRPEKDA